MKKTVDTIDEAQTVVDKLTAEQKWAIAVMPTQDGKFSIEWQEHKKYIDHTGEEQYDEIWTTAKGEMMFIQDLEPEHAKNVLRRLLRQERNAKKVLETLMSNVIEYDEEGLEGWEEITDENTNEGVNEDAFAGMTISKTIH